MRRFGLNEAVGADVLFQRADTGQHLDRGIEHGRRSADIGLQAEGVADLFRQQIGNKAPRALPGRIRRLIGQNRGELEFRQLFLPFLDPVETVKLAMRSRAPYSSRIGRLSFRAAA